MAIARKVSNVAARGITGNSLGRTRTYDPAVNRITDSMNLAQKGPYKDLQYIAPGQSWEESFWIKPSGF